MTETKTGTSLLPVTARIDDWQLHIPGKTPIDLTVQEERLLNALLSKRGRAVSAEDLLILLTDPGDAVSAVHTAIYRIRQLLRARGYDGIDSVRGRGYRLLMPSNVDAFEHAHEYHCTVCGAVQP